jgi:hypothetical protein
VGGIEVVEGAGWRALPGRLPSHRCRGQRTLVVHESGPFFGEVHLDLDVRYVVDPSDERMRNVISKLARSI